MYTNIGPEKDKEKQTTTTIHPTYMPTYTCMPLEDIQVNTGHADLT